MITLVRSELHRVATIRSSWISIAAFCTVTMLLGWFNRQAWGLLAGMGAFWLAVTIVAQHYQHRTAFLLYIAQPRRTMVLFSQLVASVVMAVGFVAVSGVLVLARGEVTQYRNVLAVMPILAVFAAASAAIVRRATWLLLGFSGWFVFIEGLLGRLEAPLPFSALLRGAGGDPAGLLIAGGWAVGAVIVALFAIRRDLSSA